MKRSIELAGGALQALEFVVFVGAATVFVAIGPVIWFYRLFAADRLAAAAVVAILWLASVVAIAREVRRKTITVVSLSVFLTWLVTLVWIFQDWFV
jgi:hypothetical protein